VAASYDVVVIGGGPAGLAGAVALGRSLRTVLVVDAGEPRNAPAAHAHNVLGREGVLPRELLADGRAEAQRYGVQVHEGTVTGAVRTDDGFTVTLADGTTTRARRLLVTTGLRDELPDVPGLAQRWGRDVLHCPFCHGWEVRRQQLVVLGTGPLAAHQAGLFRQLSDDVTLLLHSEHEPAADVMAGLTARGVRVLHGRATAVEVADDAVTGIRLESGELVPAQAVVVATGLDGVSTLPTGLGLEPTELEVGGTVLGRHLAVDGTGATAVPGVWAAGNGANPIPQVVVAAGAHTAALLKPLGLEIPLVAERGYHLQLAAPSIELELPMIYRAGGFALTPMHGGLRLGGTVEIADADAPPNYARAEALWGRAAQLLPSLTVVEKRSWMGSRPALPDSVPAVGLLPRMPRIAVVAGHGHDGMIGGPASGRLAAELLCGATPHIDPRPYRADRFGWGTVLRQAW